MKRAFVKIISKLNINIITEVKLEEVTNEGIFASDQLSKKTMIEGDTIEAGFKPDLELWNEVLKMANTLISAIFCSSFHNPKLGLNTCANALWYNFQ